MEKDIIEVELSIEKNEALFARLIFLNKSDKVIYLNKQVSYYDDMVINDYFEIKDSNGVSIDYLGIMSNCTKMPDEYILLLPGEKLSSAISLKEFYRLTKGENYNIRYYAYNPSLQQEQQQTMKMTSNKVEISY
jgi:hypothetical protein